MDGKKIGQKLRDREFKKWTELKLRGAGVSLFQEVKAHNKWLTPEEGLLNSEFTDLVKLSTNSAPVRGIPGRSRDGGQCRRCSNSSNETQTQTETLHHVLQYCPFGRLARINRHNQIRTILAKELRRQPFEVHEEVAGLADNGYVRRIDIIAIDRKTEKAVIIDPTVRFKTGLDHPKEVHEEKKRIYEPTIGYYKEKYQVEDIEVVGLLIGARGTITAFFRDFCKRFNIPESCMKTIAQAAVRGSINILRSHLYL